MQKLPSLPLSEQTLVNAVSKAVTDRVLFDVQSLRVDGGTGLSDLLDDAILGGINHALSKVAQDHATVVLGLSAQRAPAAAQGTAQA